MRIVRACRTTLVLAGCLGLGAGALPALAAPAAKHHATAAPAAKSAKKPAKKPAKPRSPQRVTVGGLAAQGFEVETVIGQEALVLQKRGQVFWCSLRVAKTSPLSYQSDCFAVH
ncbi:MAG: hypothetical protein P8Y71_26070 [Pseudolabrys sp.]|jgi:hypothetical protein